MEQISIIIPVYNGVEFINETISSCMKQDYENFEVILIDDCSTDGSYEHIQALIAESYQDKSNISLLRNDKNSGMLFSCNYGAKISKAHWILFLGQDDMLPEHYLSTVIGKMDLETTAFAFCNPMVIDAQGNEIGRSRKNPEHLYSCARVLYREISKECVISSTGLIINRQAFLRVGGHDTKYTNYGEWNLWIRLLAIGDYCFVDDVYSFYRKHNTNMTKSFTKKSTLIALNQYWNECRILAQQTLVKNKMDLMDSKIYYMYVNLKNFLLRLK